MVRNGQLRVRVLRNGHPSPPLAPEPVCTRSQLLGYFNLQGDKVAECHQYLRQDGTIGASGMPDPKRLVEAGVLYVVQASGVRPPPRRPRRRRR
jgi:hypothetical protein